MPAGNSQNCPSGHGMPTIVPHRLSHTPRSATFTPARAASQGLPWSLPSQPQTGSRTARHTWARSVHTPMPSQAPGALAQ
jgi:hypothetical protein